MDVRTAICSACIRHVLGHRQGYTGYVLKMFMKVMVGYRTEQHLYLARQSVGDSLSMTLHPLTSTAYPLLRNTIPSGLPAATEYPLIGPNFCWIMWSLHPSLRVDRYSKLRFTTGAVCEMERPEGVVFGRYQMCPDQCSCNAVNGVSSTAWL